LIPIFFVELVEFAGSCHPVAGSGFDSWFQILCSRVSAFSRGSRVCLFLFYWEGTT
jgi:hypothetical protein